MQIIFNIKDKLGSPLVVTNGIFVNDILVSGSLSSHTIVVNDYDSVKIEIASSGYYPLTLNIDNVYDTNKVIDLTLVDIITDINDPEYNKPYPSFVAFNSPCAMRIDFYNTSSYTGNIEWYINNELLATGDSSFVEVCNPQEIQIKQRVVTYRTVQSINYCPITERVWDLQLGSILTGNTVPGVLDDLQIYLDLDTQSNFEIVDFRPVINIELSSPKDQLNSSCCYTRGELLTITPVIEIKTHTEVDYLVSYQITGPKSIITVVNSSTILTNDLVREFRLNDLGTYKILIKVENLLCGTFFYKEVQIETCNFFTIEYLECSQFQFKNNSSYREVTVTIDDILDNSLLSQQDLKPGYTLSTSFSGVSLYFVTITYLVDTKEVQEVYVINNYCLVEDCLTSYLEDLLCAENIRCKECPDPIELNRFLLLLFSYNMKLNAEYGNNNYYSLISESKFSELMTIQSIVDKIKEYCSRIGCLNILTKGFTYNCFSTPTDFSKSSSEISGCKTCGK